MYVIARHGNCHIECVQDLRARDRGLIPENRRLVPLARACVTCLLLQSKQLHQGNRDQDRDGTYTLLYWLLLVFQLPGN